MFRSEQYALVDNACREYLFLSEFFIVKGPAALDLFNHIMGKTLSLLTVRNIHTEIAQRVSCFTLTYGHGMCILLYDGNISAKPLFQKSLESYVSECYDMIALFLCFHLILRYQLMCHKRCVPALDKYWEFLQRLILPRFEHVFRLNIGSIRDCDPTRFNREMGPHYVSILMAPTPSVSAL